MKSTAVITGATAGIGRVFADLLAREGHDLVLVARTEVRLNEVAAEISAATGVTCEVLVADLSDRAQLQRVEERVSQRDVEVLINNAGFGLNQKFSAGDREREQLMLDVLVTAVMRLTHAALQPMRQKNLGSIVIVSSVASFIAGGSYSAAKAWTTVFTESLAIELRNTNITVTALCPGFTHTEFHQRAGINKRAIPNFMWLDAGALVRAGWRDHQRGKVVSVPGWQYRILLVLIRVIPRPVVIRFNQRIRSRNK
jgi:short-subunit dehydrogenase